MKSKLSIYKIFGILILLSFISGPVQVMAFSSQGVTTDKIGLKDLTLDDKEFLSALSNADESLASLTTGFSREEAALKGLEDYSERFSTQEQSTLNVTPEIAGDPKISEDLNLGNLLADNQDDYRKIWEPWQTKAAVRTMITSPDKEFLLVGGGYLYDNTIKVYRYNHVTDEYEHVWDSGDEIIKSDVVSLAWGDLNYNRFPEVIAGSADGHVYVFEQSHIYDPKTNTENQFQFAWKSPLLEQVWGLAAADTDLDLVLDVVAGSWDGKVHWYEAVDLGDQPVYPYAVDHTIDMREKYSVTLPGNQRVTALATTDTDGDGLPEIVVGTWSGDVFVYENNGTVFEGQGGVKIPIPQQNSYRLDYENYEQFWNPITKIAVGNLDSDSQDELAFLVPGQGVYTFDYDFNTKQYFFNKLTKPPESWELGTSGVLDVLSAGYPVNSYVDWMVWGNNVLSKDNEIVPGQNFKEEPFEAAFRDAYPYNTSMAFLPNNSYSYFGWKLFNHTPAINPLLQNVGENSSAIVDFGFTQEATGDGRFNDGVSLKGYDLWFYMDKNYPARPKQWEIQVSADGEVWSDVHISETTTSACSSYCILYIDTDPALNRMRMLEYRYVKMTYFTDGSHVQKVDSVYTTTLARPLSEATALTIGTIDVDYSVSVANQDESDKVIVGSSDGKMFAYEYDPSAGSVKQLWTSYNGISDLFTLGTNIWDIVQVNNEGKIPTWRARTDISNVTLSEANIPGGYVSHTHAHLFGLDLLYDFIPRQTDDLIVTTKDGYTLFYPQSKDTYSPQLTNSYFYAVNDQFGGSGWQLSHGFGDANNDTYPELMVTGAWDPNIIADPSINKKANAGLYLWLSAGLKSGLPNYLGPIDLVGLEQTGMLANALANSRAQPAASFADLDKDGDLDIIFTNGQAYVLWNVLGGLVYRLDTEYFAYVNDHTRGRLYTNPIGVDFDGDDDFDIVISNTLTGSKPKYGGTYWINEGTPTQPEWREDKWLFVNSPPPDKNQTPPESNLDFHNYTSFAFLYDHKTGKVENMTAFGHKLNAIVGFQADYINHDHFIVATYPLLKRVEINIRNSDTYKNWGYRVFETWNTQSELKEWTQSISTGDLDGDGKGEVIVGDYDNNVYVFEYLTSGLNGSVNTYKRAFRSFDLTQTERLNESPYAAEDLPGIGATNFNRTLWKHASFLLTGVDLNKNGFEEIVVTAGLSIFIFEKTLRVDTYKLLWMTDLRFSKFSKFFTSASEITALGGGFDMDFNGRGEFIVAVGSILMMFEYSGNDQFVELYGGTTVLPGFYLFPNQPLNGRYASLGNLYFATAFDESVWANLQITSLVVEDVNNNNLQDIVVGGYYKQPWGRVDGYLAILEHHLGTITPIYEMDLRVLREIPIYDILVADQDYDGLKELIIGHKKGVDIWEYNDTVMDPVTFDKLTHITSSMNHPIIPLNLVLIGYDGSISDNYDLRIRDHDLLMVRYQLGDWLDPNDMVEVVVFGPALILIFTKDDGKTWFPLPGAVLGGYVFEQPTIVQRTNAEIIVAFRDKSTGNIYAVEVNPSGNQYIYGSVDLVRTELGVDFYSPSLYKNPSSPNGVSITYIRDDSGNRTIEFENSLGGGSWSGVLGMVPGIGLNLTYSVSSQDVVYHRPTGGFVLAFSGLKYKEFKPDRDIFIMFADNDSLLSNFTSRVAFNSVDDLFPSISTLIDEHDDSIIVAYEERGVVPGGRIMVSHSETRGQTWNPPEPLPTQLDNVINYCFEGLGCFQFLAIPTKGGLNSGQKVSQETVYNSDVETGRTAKDIPDFIYVWIAGVEAFSPAIVGRVNGGFGFTYAMNVLYGDYLLFLQNVVLTFYKGLAAGIQSLLKAQQQGGNAPQQNNNPQEQQAYLMLDLKNKASKSYVVSHSTVLGKVPILVSGVNPSSVFAKFSNGETIALAQGDSDGDAKQEVLIASDRGLFLEELETSGIGLHTRQYVETYTKEYDHGLHDVTMYDTNGNGFEELIVAGEEGNVYSYEVVNVYRSTTDLHFLKKIWEDDKSILIAKGPNIGQLLKSVNATGDSKLDVLYASPYNSSGLIRLVNGDTGSVLWSVYPEGDHGIQGPMTYLESDGSMVVVGFKNGQILSLNLANGAKLWNSSSTGYPVLKIVFGSFETANTQALGVAYPNQVVGYRTTGLTYTSIGDLAMFDSYVDIFPINVENGTGMTDLGLVGINGRVGLYHYNPFSLNYYNLTYVNGSIVGGTAIGTDITGDGIDELIMAANSILTIIDVFNNDSMVFNNTSNILASHLRSVTFNQNNNFGRDLIVESIPETITFEEIFDPGSFVQINSTYSSQGIVFSDSWATYNSTAAADTIRYPAVSGQNLAFLGGDLQGFIEFNVSQQYVKFYIDIFSDEDVQVVGLDQGNNTIYVSPVIHNGTFIPVHIALTDSSLKRIMFTGKETFAGWLTIDDLTFGGTQFTSFDLNQEIIDWQYSLIPSSDTRIHQSENIHFGKTSQLLTIGYDIHPEWSTFFNAHEGSITLDIASGMPFNTLNPGRGIHEAVAIGESEFTFLHDNSLLETYGTITDQYYPDINYGAQNEALWQLNTNKPFRTIDKGNLDADSAEEFVLTDGKDLLIAVDNNHDILWKYRTKAIIRDVLLANFLSTSGPDQVAILLSDGTILLLDAELGLPVSANFPQYLQNYEYITGISIDFNNDGREDLVTGSGRPANPAGGRVSFLTYNLGTANFNTVSQHNTAGWVTQLEQTDFDADGSVNDVVALGKDYRIYGFNNDQTSQGTYTDTAQKLVVGDLDTDGLPEIVFFNKNNEVKVLNNVLGLLDTIPAPSIPNYSGAESLVIMDYYKDDNFMDIAVQFRAHGIYIYDKAGGNTAFWSDPAIFSTIVGKMDLDLDGFDDIVVTNDNLIYALSHQSPYLMNSPLPHWSSPLSSNRIINALPIDLTGDGRMELVFMNNGGEIFAVESIKDPLTLMRPLVIKSIDTLSWTVTNIPDDFYEFLYLPIELSEKDTKSTENNWTYIPIELFLLLGLASGVIVAMLGMLVKNKRSFLKLIRKRLESDLGLGGDNQ